MAGVMTHRLGCFNLASAGGGGGISFVGSGTLVTGTSYSFSSLLDEGGGTPTLLENDLVVVFLGTASTTADSEANLKPTGYSTAFAPLYVNDSSDANLMGSYKFMGATPDAGFSYTARTAMAGTIFVFRGVDTTTPLDVTPTTATGDNTGKADPPAITPMAVGAWIIVTGIGAHMGDRIIFTNPGDLSGTTNHFRAQLGLDVTNDSNIATGIKTDWTSGAFDPLVFDGGSTSAAASWAAATLALRPA